MAITRRTFIKGAAALPLATLPGLAFAKGPKMPTADDVLTFGELWDLDYAWNDDEMKNLYAETASQLRAELVDTIGYDTEFHVWNGAIPEIWTGRVNNFFGFMIEHTDPALMTFAAVTLFTHYRLPIAPHTISNFDKFHDKAGDYIWDELVPGGESMHEEISRFVANNPKCYSAVKQIT